MKLTSETIEVSIQELETLVDDALKQPLSEENHRKLKGAIQTLAELARMLADQETTLSQLRALLLKAATTEKTEKTVRGCVRDDGAGRGGGRQVRRDVGEHGGDAEVWERSSVPPAGRAAGKSGDSVAGFDAVGDGGGGGGVDRAGARRVDPAGGAR